MKWFFRTDVQQVAFPGYPEFRKRSGEDRLVIDANDPQLDHLIRQTGSASTNPAQSPLTYEEEMAVKDEPKTQREQLGELLAGLISERTTQDIRQQRRGRMNRVNVG
jgi:hypothetical protein